MYSRVRVCARSLYTFVPLSVDVLEVVCLEVDRSKSILSESLSLSLSLSISPSLFLLVLTNTHNMCFV